MTRLDLEEILHKKESTGSHISIDASHNVTICDWDLLEALKIGGAEANSGVGI